MGGSGRRQVPMDPFGFIPLPFTLVRREQFSRGRGMCKSFEAIGLLTIYKMNAV